MTAQLRRKMNAVYDNLDSAAEVAIAVAKDAEYLMVLVYKTDAGYRIKLTKTTINEFTTANAEYGYWYDYQGLVTTV